MLISSSSGDVYYIEKTIPLDINITIQGGKKGRPTIKPFASSPAFLFSSNQIISLKIKNVKFEALNLLQFSTSISVHIDTCRFHGNAQKDTIFQSTTLTHYHSSQVAIYINDSIFQQCAIIAAINGLPTLHLHILKSKFLILKIPALKISNTSNINLVIMGNTFKNCSGSNIFDIKGKGYSEVKLYNNHFIYSNVTNAVMYIENIKSASVTKCNFTRNYGTNGMMHIIDSRVIILKCHFSNNNGHYVAAIRVLGSTANVINCNFDSNYGSVSGTIKVGSDEGHCKNLVYINNCHFLYNAAGISGGAIDNEGDINSRLTINNSHFRHNRATTRGGTLHQKNGKLIILNSVFNVWNNDSNTTLGTIFYGISQLNFTTIKNSSFRLTNVYDSRRQASIDQFIIIFNIGPLKLVSPFTFSCPKGFNIIEISDVPSLTKSASTEYTYIFVHCNQCPNGTYSTKSGSIMQGGRDVIKCQDCPPEGNCHGFISNKENYWGYRKNEILHFISCPDGFCSAGSSKYNSCAAYREGRLCGRCMRNYSESIFSSDCVSNDKCKYNALIWPLIFIINILTFVVVLYLKEIGMQFPKVLNKCINRHDQNTNEIKLLHEILLHQENGRFMGGSNLLNTSNLESFEPSPHSSINTSTSGKPVNSEIFTNTDNEADINDYAGSNSNDSQAHDVDNDERKHKCNCNNVRTKSNCMCNGLQEIVDDDDDEGTTTNVCSEPNDDEAETKSNNMYFGVVKILFFFYQVQKLLQIPIDNNVSDVLRDIHNTIASVSNFDILTYLHNGLKFCAILNLNSIKKQYLKIGFAEFLIIWCLLVKVILIFLKKCGKVSESRICQNRLNVCLVHLLLLTHYTIATSSIMLIHCVPIFDKKDIWILRIDGNSECLQVYQKIVIVSIALFTGPFVFAVYIGTSLLSSNRIEVRDFFVILFVPFVSFIYMIKFFCVNKTNKRKEIAAGNVEGVVEGNVEGVAEGNVEGNAAGNVEGNAAGNVEGNAAGNALCPDKALIINIIQGPFMTKCNKHSNWSLQNNWQSIIILRMVILTFVKIFIDNIIIRVYVMTAFVFIFLSHHNLVQPYNISILNKLETGSLTLVLLQCVINIYWSLSFGTKQTTPIKLLGRFFEYGHFVILFVPILLLLGLWLREKHDRKKKNQ